MTDQEKQKNTNKPKSEGVIMPKLLNVLYQSRYFITVLESVMILVFGYLFLIKHTVNSVFNNQQRNEIMQYDMDLQISEINKKITNAKKLLGPYGSISEKDRDYINKILPDEAELKEVFAQIVQMVKSNGLLLDSFKINEAQADSQNSRRPSPEDIEEVEKPYGELEFDIKISGATYRSLKSLLSSFESNIRLIDVKSVGFDPDKFSAEMQLSAYYFKKNINNTEIREVIDISDF
ncbi:MAG: hypothetical protein Q8Q23_05660 [bacterium]|nr:hypothetical protein [bacterium]